MATSQRDQTKEAIRLSVIQYGMPETARKYGIKYDTIKKWNKRYKWSVPVETRIAQQAAVPIVPVARAIDAVQQEIQSNGKETKLSLSRSAKRMAKDSEQATLRHAPYVHKVAQMAQIVHPELYASKEKDQSQVAVNIAILDCDPGKYMVEKHVQANSQPDIDV